MLTTKRKGSPCSQLSPVKANTYSKPALGGICVLFSSNWNFYFKLQPETHTGCTDHNSKTNTNNRPVYPCMQGVPHLTSLLWKLIGRHPQEQNHWLLVLHVLCSWSVLPLRAPHVREPVCVAFCSPSTLTTSEDFGTLGMATVSRFSPICSQTPRKSSWSELSLCPKRRCLIFTLYEIK